MKNAVGIIGGLGPMATVYFMDLIVEMTDAAKDQDHINMLVSNHATIPDRTEYVLGRSSDSPKAPIIEDALMLQDAGCSFLVMPCNTAHLFYDEIRECVSIPVIGIIEETIRMAEDRIGDLNSIGLMATEGTIAAGNYDRHAEPLGIRTIVPDPEYQKKVNYIIYDRIKAGLPAAKEDIMEIADHLRANGAQAIIMGCTELSIAYKDLALGRSEPDMVDSLEALAKATVLRSGKKIKNT